MAKQSKYKLLADQIPAESTTKFLESVSSGEGKTHEKIIKAFKEITGQDPEGGINPFTATKLLEAVKLRSQETPS